MATSATPTFPPGYLEQYIGHQLVQFATAFIVINIFFVGLRYVARYVSKTPIGLDDYLMIPGLIGGVALCAISIAFVHNGGGGYHIAAVALTDPSKLATFAKLEVTFAVVYLLSVTFPKLAMLSLFLRIFVERWHRIACYVLMGILVATAISTIVANLTQCIPLASLWTPTIKGHCFNQNAYWAWGSLPNIITDVLMIILPIPAIWKIQLSWKDKIGVMLTFMTGGIGIITSFLRFFAFLDTDGVGPTADGTWTAIVLSEYSIAEVSVYLIAACLPTYRSLYLAVRRSRTTNAGSNRSGSYARRMKTYKWPRSAGSSNDDDTEVALSSYPGPQRGYNKTTVTAGFNRLDDQDGYLLDSAPRKHDAHSAVSAVKRGQ